MEPSDASCWFTDFDMNYSSFLQGIEQFDELSQSPAIPDLSPISADQCCLSNSNSEPNPNPESNIPDAVIDQNKMERKPRGKKWNSGLKNVKGKSKEKIVKSDGTNYIMNDPSSHYNGRKRSFDETTDASAVTNNIRSTVLRNDQEEIIKKDHLMAERKRREKLTQRFIALSSLLPDLTRMDKASVLEDAVKYVKQLQERVTELEAQGMQRTVEGAVIIGKPESFTDESNSSINNNNNSPCDDQFLTKTKSLPEIDVRFSELGVLVKIYYESQKGVIAKALQAIESIGLCVISTSAVPFGNSSLDLTITAKVDSELSMSAEDLVKRIIFYIK